MMRKDVSGGQRSKIKKSKKMLRKDVSGVNSNDSSVK
jgi:hypothetical protein